MDTQKTVQELHELLKLGACTEQDATVAAHILAREPETFEHMKVSDAVDMALDLARVRQRE
jgi:hypothetical protein